MADNFMASFSSFIEAGGPVVVVLLVMSVFLLAVVFIKLWQFHRLGILASDIVGLHREAVGHWQKREYEAVERQCAANGQGAFSRLLATANAHLAHKHLRGQELTDELLRIAQGVLARLRTHLRSIEVIANLAPLLGLLGTVLGMISAFQAMEVAGKQVDPAVLSGGIWEALLTTAVGLIVAMPAVLAFNWFERRIESCAELMQDTIGQVNTLQAMEAAGHHFKSDANVKVIHSANA
jgi:biopolymer transport protein ExbB